VGTVAVGTDAIGYTIHCEYPDGTKVLCAGVAELRDGKIARETASRPGIPRTARASRRCP
jgi:hypothetical protein